MSLQLDARQRAMLEEMGIKLFWPEPGAVPDAVQVAVREPAGAAAPDPPLPAAAEPRQPAPASSGPLLWDAQRAGKAAAVEADWLVLVDAAGEDSELAAQAGKLLDNMLVAMGLTRQHKVAIWQSPAPSEAALRAEVERLRPKLLLVMGRAGAQAMLQTAEPVGRLRGRAHQFHGVPVVVTFPPAYLLRNGADKARAWADLCLALDLQRQPA